MADYSSVCDDEADLWRKCVEQHLGMPEVEVTCQLHEDHFHKCVQKWRSDVGPGVILKGANEGEPPPQCAAMSCLVGACLRQHNYDFKRCKPPMDFFKRCVKGFYGSEYIM